MQFRVKPIGLIITAVITLLLSTTTVQTGFTRKFIESQFTFDNI